jgi:integrase
MPSVWKDKHGIIISFKTHVGKQRRQRTDKSMAEAKALAQACEVLCQKLGKRASRADIEAALALNAITEEEAAILQGKAVVSHDLLSLALSHPSTIREQGNQREFKRHMREMKLFIEQTGITDLSRLSLSAVVNYVKEMEEAGASPDGIRHRLLWVRRASWMAGTMNKPDPLRKFKLVPRKTKRVRDVFTLEEMLTAAERFKAMKDRRPLAVLILGGFMGLRPSEIFSIRLSDISGGVLSTGKKNDPSERLLPVPECLSAWIPPLVDRAPDAYLICPLTGHGGFRDRPFTDCTFPAWINPLLAAATGKNLSVEFLRKSFSTFCIEARLNPYHFERMMGHKVSGVTRTTRDHYAFMAEAETIRPTVELIDDMLNERLMLHSMLQSGNVVEISRNLA